MQKILVSGSVAYDTVIHVAEAFVDNILPEKLSALSVGFFSHQTIKSPGGTAHNIAYNLGLLGHKKDTVMLASVGHDFQLDAMLTPYISYNHIVVDSDRLTAGAYILTDKNKHQITAFHPGAMQLAETQVVPAGSLAYAIIAPNAKGAMLAHAAQAHGQGAKVFFDPGQAMSLFTQEDIMHVSKFCDYLIVNDYEYSFLQKIASVSESELRTLFPTIVVTKGADGVQLLSPHEEIHIHACRDIVAVDPTGAGDAFRAGLLSGLVRGLDWTDALSLANVVASFVVEYQGTLGHVFSMEEVSNRFKENYGKDISL